METVATPPVPYCGPVPDPARLLASWTPDPMLLAPLAVLLALAIHRRSPALMLAWAALVLAFVSPLCALTTALFTARTLHHLLLLGLAAPALAVALPLPRRLPAAPAFAATALLLVLWHLPPVYSAAWNSAAVYWLMQLAMIGAGWALWSALLGTGGDLGDAALLGAMAAVMGLIGAILTFAPRPLYAEHLTGAPLWGLDALQDQQLAGLVMWVPGMLPVAALAALCLRRAWQRSLA